MNQDQVKEIYLRCRDADRCVLGMALKLKFPMGDPYSGAQWKRNPPPRETAHLLGISEDEAERIADLWDHNESYEAIEQALLLGIKFDMVP